VSAPLLSYQPLTPEGYREPRLRLLDNPILIAQARRQLRKRQASQSAALHLLLGVLIAFGASQIHVSDQVDESAWRWARNLLSWMMLFTLYFRGSSALSAALLSERDGGCFTFFRASPLSPLSVAVGYLLGATARAYLSALALAPAWLVCAHQGGASPLELTGGLLALIGGALTFHSVTLAFALSGTRGAQRAASLFLLWLPFFFAEPLNAAGLHTLSHITPKPLLNSLGLTFWSEHFSAARVLLFQLPLSHLTYTLIVQGLVVCASLWVATRRIERDAQPLVSRAGGLALLCALTALIAGVDLNPHALTPAATLSAYGGGLPGGVALLGLCALGAIALLLLSTPTLISARRAVARATRDGGSGRLSWWLEGASLRPFTALLILYVLGTFTAHTLLHFGSAGLTFALEAGLWPPLLSCATALVAISGLSEAFSLQRARLNYALSLSTSLSALFLLPLLGALLAASLSARQLIEPISCFSPLYALAYAAARLSRGVAGDALPSDIGAFTQPLYFVLSLLTGLLSGALGYKKAEAVRARVAEGLKAQGGAQPAVTRGAK
jgi:hypothetical protein